MVLADTPQRGEHGFSLVESVVAVAVLGIIVSAMVGGMATSIATSSIHRQQSTANAAMVSTAETIKAAPYASCAVDLPNRERAFSRLAGQHRRALLESPDLGLGRPVP